MLSRAVLRSLQAPAARIPSSSSRIATSTVWSRSMAQTNHPNNQNKKHTGNSPSLNQPRQGGSASSQQPSRKSGGSHQAGSPDYTRRQAEFDTGASPKQNTLPSQGKGAGAPRSDLQQGNPEFSTKQNEFETAQPSENTAPQSTSPSAIDPAEVKKQQPLPDLTKGLPSTLDFEIGGGKHPLDLSEVEEPQADGEGGGRRRGELPASAYISSSEKRRARVANWSYAIFGATMIGAGVYMGRNWENEAEEKKHAAAPSGWSIGLMWNRIMARADDQLSFYKDPVFEKLLPDQDPKIVPPGGYTLVLNFEDLMIHSEWTREHGWRLAKRPGVDYFIRYLSQYYELVVFTDQPSSLAEPVIRKFDPYHLMLPLYREAAKYQNGEYVKDLSYLNRDLKKVILIDTKASSARNQPENAIILPPWKGDAKDHELVALIPFLEYLNIMEVKDVRTALKTFAGKHIPSEFAQREAVARKKFNEALAEEQKKGPKRSGAGALASVLGLKPVNYAQDPTEQNKGEAFAQGKMLQDIARERGQKQYEFLEKQIRENGPTWLKEEAEYEEKARKEMMSSMGSGFGGLFGGGGEKK